ncbi:HAMP domain-containing sensor histidine kinase [Spongiactinospora sp. TRM90649]|uniref:sensor histidine kinase n=1 Tax=Spongiactinospora sp. TRM90649 TaxID=3031114 RepID=UPI0023F80E47|nr:HAMP domain-containing sensor histidine kinase [Spongiactinospora sp. TRM90649]MDF5752871.1 HAMP domain-containing sensor histidine kinase [Spongiactinospora sp. TRM90649]
MSLRTRLVVTMVGLLAVALAVAAGATFGAIQDWRGPGGSRLLELSTPGEVRAAYDELSERVALVLVGSSVAALVCLTLVAARLIRAGLRPLDRIVATAAAIGGGDLGRRVEPGRPGTEVGRLGAALNAMLGQIEGAFREREASEDRLRRFVADASHELRTPVATIRGYAELFRRGAAGDQAGLAKAMSRIEAEATRMGALVDELLLLARLDQGRPLERAPVELTELAAEAVADTLAIDPGRPLSLDHEGPVVVPGDAARLRQAVGNLLANVLDHTPEGTGARVWVGVEDGHAVVEVADEGPGLTEEQAGLVFQRFYRAEHTVSVGGRRTGGAGLGLSIVAAIAAAHGGEVTARTGRDIRKGAVFRVRLPLSPPRR